MIPAGTKPLETMMKLRLSVLVANLNADGTPKRTEDGAISRRLFDVVVAQSDRQAESLCAVLGVAVPNLAGTPSVEVALDSAALKDLTVMLPAGKLTVNNRIVPGYEAEPGLSYNVREALRYARLADAIAHLTATGETSPALSHLLQDA